ncbi:MAG: 4-(cytidine 5'-diphospho)-2-C-methyl-D-erythritol kinase [Firmicutes bacterium]|nr:4-(cytidine 5'-diphospho)-2-C-methyl-D-erythritol kinase [Bacillota bacterium]
MSHAKINLTLEVLYRRPDGFHQIETVLQELELADSLYLEELPDGRIELFCDHPLLPADQGNLAFKAAVCFQEYAPGRGVQIRLHKRIPIAAGLGGGSSNAAAVLKGLQILWGVPLKKELLFKMAADLGSDVSFFLCGGTALATGRGEQIRPLPPLPRAKVLLVSPANLMLSAGRVYGALVPGKQAGKNKTRELVKALEEEREESLLSRLPDLLINDLEEAAFSLDHKILLLKEKLRKNYGFTALLSGSGPTVFALSYDEEKLAEACRELADKGYSTILTETKGTS